MTIFLCRIDVNSNYKCHFLTLILCVTWCLSVDLGEIALTQKDSKEMLSCSEIIMQSKRLQNKHLQTLKLYVKLEYFTCGCCQDHSLLSTNHKVLCCAPNTIFC